MGVIKKIVCRSCGHTWHCHTGCGMNHARLESVIGLFRRELQDKILQETQGQPFPLFTFGYQPAHCENCHDIVSVPVLELGQDNHKYIGECPKCRLEIKQEQLKENITCPICSGHEFDESRDGSWD